eukprot:3209361-Pyramimonas_sp.AAC.1
MHAPSCGGGGMANRTIAIMTAPLIDRVYTHRTQRHGTSAVHLSIKEHRLTSSLLSMALNGAM